MMAPGDPVILALCLETLSGGLAFIRTGLRRVTGNECRKGIGKDQGNEIGFEPG